MHGHANPRVCVLYMRFSLAGVVFSVGYVILDRKYTLRGTVGACGVGLLGVWLVARAILGR